MSESTVEERLLDLLLDHQPVQENDGQRRRCDCGEPWSVTHQADIVASHVAEALARPCIHDRIEASSLGTPAARAARASTPPGVARRVVERAEEIRREQDLRYDLVADAVVGPDEESDEVTREPTYGLCLACRSVEVALVQVAGTRDLSTIGESAEYPVGFGCEVCS